MHSYSEQRSLLPLQTTERFSGRFFQPILSVCSLHCRKTAPWLPVGMWSPVFCHYLEVEAIHKKSLLNKIAYNTIMTACLGTTYGTTVMFLFFFLPGFKSSTREMWLWKDLLVSFPMLRLRPTRMSYLQHRHAKCNTGINIHFHVSSMCLQVFLSHLQNGELSPEQISAAWSLSGSSGSSGAENAGMKLGSCLGTK